MNPALAAYEKGWIRPVGGGEGCEEFLARLDAPSRFALVVASTDTAEIEGISAAGATPFMRRYTAALDAEYLLFGRPLSMPDVPRNPLGPPSPVLISRAALTALGIAPIIVDAGTKVAPMTPRLVLGTGPGRVISTGQALDLPAGFARSCRAAARMIAPEAGHLVLAESVPGGTTTALALLEALGVSAHGKVSSSMPGGNHPLKERVVASALRSANLGPHPRGLEAACAVGDPMQPAVAFMALEASLSVPVVLGGGTQMAAVWALIARLLDEGEEGNPANIALATTSWVATDAAADLAGILAQIPRKIAAFYANMNFSSCRSPGLRRYEEGLVKEGVGAGAAAFSALATGISGMAELIENIDVLAEGLDGDG